MTVKRFEEVKHSYMNCYLPLEKLSEYEQTGK